MLVSTPRFLYKPPSMRAYAPRGCCRAHASMEGEMGRRDLVQATLASVVAFTALPSLASPPVLLAEGTRVFFDIKVEQDLIGKLVIELFPDVPVGAQRFLDLAVGVQGVGYRLSKFDEITDTYVANAGVRNLSYSASTETLITGGGSTLLLEEEMAAPSRHLHTSAGLVSLVVRPATPPQIQERLVAQKGKLVTVREEVGDRPNGTAFVLTLGPAPALDATHLVVGRLVEGASVLQKIAALETVPDNSDSVFFKAGKAAGDKRAVTAELAFNRPFDRVVIAKAGVVV